VTSAATCKRSNDAQFYPEAKTKLQTGGVAVLPSGACAAGEGAASAKSCFDGAASVGVYASSIANKTVSDASLPVGCSVVAAADGSATAYYNTDATGTAGCKEQPTKTAAVDTAVGVSVRIALASTGMGKVTFDRSEAGYYCSKNRVGVLKAFAAKSAAAPDSTAALGACEAYCKAAAGACQACSVVPNSQVPEHTWAALPDCGQQMRWGGAIVGDVSLKNGAEGGTATLTITGPAEGWFGVGINAKMMTDSPYSLIVNDTAVVEQKIGTCGTEAEHCPGDRLAKSITVKSSTVSGGKRTVVVTRALAGASKDHFSFDYAKLASMPVIAAVGSSQTFAYHKAHSSVPSITFTTVGAPTCVCDAPLTGEMCHNGGTGCESFVKACKPAPAGSLLAQANPTCDSGHYAGGLRCCTHDRIMLDQEQQAASLAGDVLRYHMKVHRGTFLPMRYYSGTLPPAPGCCCGGTSAPLFCYCACSESNRHSSHVHRTLTTATPSATTPSTSIATSTSSSTVPLLVPGVRAERVQARPQGHHQPQQQHRLALQPAAHLPADRGQRVSRPPVLPLPALRA
jgi:hypothetical protein